MKSDAYSALRIPDYRRFLGMRLLTTLSIQIMSVSVGYLIYELTNSKLMLGYIGLTEAIPAICTSLLAGHYVDKYNRRKILIGCMVLLTFCASILLTLVLKKGVISQQFLISGIFGVIFITGIARAFFSPANFALLPQLVSKEQLGNAITWNSSTWEVASVTGLGLGGLLYGFAGVEWAFGTMTFLSVAGLFFAWAISRQPDPDTNRSIPMVVKIKEGLDFVFSNKIIRAALAFDLFAVLFGGAVALLPVFAKDILKVGPEGFGLLRAAMSIGAISMAFFIAHKPIGKNAGKMMFFCVAGFGISIIAFGLSTWFWFSFLCLVMAGVFDEVSVFVRQALVQYQTPDHMKGRVSSVNSIFITSSNEIGAFESGVTARLMGTVTAVVFGGCMTLAVTAITWWKSPQLRQLDFSEKDNMEE